MSGSTSTSVCVHTHTCTCEHVTQQAVAPHSTSSQERMTPAKRPAEMISLANSGFGALPSEESEGSQYHRSPHLPCTSHHHPPQNPQVLNRLNVAPAPQRARQAIMTRKENCLCPSRSPESYSTLHSPSNFRKRNIRLVLIYVSN